MKGALVLLVAVAISASLVAAHQPKWHELTAEYSFEAYVKAWGKTYSGAGERAMRAKVFAASLEKVLAHNAQSASTYKKGINKFSDWTADELAGIRGARVEPKYVPKHAVPHVPAGSANRTVDYRAIPGVLSAVKDQGQCGDCWAHAVTEAIESSYALATGQLFSLSQQQVTSCTPMTGSCYSCNGSFPSLGFDYVAEAGITEEWIYPFASYEGQFPECRKNPFVQTPIPTIVNITGYTQVAANSQQDTMDALTNLGPLAILADASEWSDYESGLFDGCSYAKNISLDHAINLVGYGEENGNGYWIVRNSWAPSWGENGFIRIAKPDVPECGWNVGAAYSAGCYGSGPNQVWSCGTCGVLFSPQFANVNF